MSVTYTAVLDTCEDSVLFLSSLPQAERLRRGTRKATRVQGTYKQAVLVLRWFLDDTRMSALARDNGIAVSTAYDYRDEGIAVLTARRPGGNIQAVSTPDGWPLRTSHVRPSREHDMNAARTDPELLARITDCVSHDTAALIDQG